MADLSYDSIEMGKQYGPWKYPLAERIERHLEAVENQHEWHHRRSPWGPPVAPPSMLGNAAMRFLDTIGTVPPGTLHAKQEIHTESALRLDRKLIMYGSFVDKYEKRGRRWFVFEARCRDTDGLIIGRSRLTMTFPKGNGQEEIGNEERTEEGSGSKKSEVGRRTPEEAGVRKGELPAVVRTLTQERMTAYSEDSANALRGTSIHVNPEAAKKAGFETTVAQGLMCADYISEMMTEALGRDWFGGSDLSLAFLRQALCGDMLTANGRLADSVAEGALVRRTYEVWCENERSETVAAGSAGALVMREQTAVT